MRHIGIKITLLTIQLAVYFCLWYQIVFVTSVAFPPLRSMDAFCATARTNGFFFIDFVKNYVCAQIAQTNPTMIWDPAVQTKTINADLQAQPNDPGQLARQVNCAPYTPQSLLLFLPLTRLPLNLAIIVFEIFSLIFFITTITFLLKRYQNYSYLKIAFWWFIALSTFPFMQNICLGQIAGIIAGLLAIFFLTWRNKNVILPALCFALTIAIKPQRGLVMLVMSIADRRYRLLSVTFLFSILLLISSGLVMGFDTVCSYPSKLLNIESARYPLYLHEHFDWTTSYGVGFPAILSAFVPQSTIRWLLVGTTLFDLSIMYFAWRKAINIGPKSFPLAFGFSVMTDLVWGPYEPLYDVFLINVVWAANVGEFWLHKLAQLKDSNLRFWLIAFSLFPPLSWLAECFFGSIGGLLHMILLMLFATITFFMLLKLYRAADRL